MLDHVDLIFMIGSTEISILTRSQQSTTRIPFAFMWMNQSAWDWNLQISKSQRNSIRDPTKNILNQQNDSEEAKRKGWQTVSAQFTN